MRVLIVDDSSVIRGLLRHIVETAGMSVVGEAYNGQQAVAMALDLKPDVITMDIDMPVMDGCEASRQIMETQPTPIVVVTASYSHTDTVLAMKVLEAGAITVLQKPQGPGHPYFERDAAALITTIKLISEIKLVRRVPRPWRIPVASQPIAKKVPEVIAIGASTGGPVALKEMLEALSPTIQAPVLIVQHISPGFLSSFCEWLGQACRLPVSIGEYGEKAQPSHIYLAPDNCHMEIDAGGCIHLGNGSPHRHNRPSVGRLFESIAAHYGARAIAVLLSGMGQDGAQEMLKLHSLGALTLIQEQSSVVVNGMPGEALRLGAVTQAAAPKQLAEIINNQFLGSI